jgi:NADH-quinone oxidoreductase subunit M
VLAAIYLLWAYERVFTGVPDKPENLALSDVNGREIALMAPLVVLILVLGLYPQVLLDKTSASTEAVLDRIEAETDFEVPAPGRLADLYVAGGEE